MDKPKSAKTSKANEAIEAEIIKDNDGKRARKKVAQKRNFQDLVAPILVDLALLFFGFCLLIWADTVMNFVSITLGIIFILYGLYNFVDYNRSAKVQQNSSSVITGILLIIAGLFLATQTSFIKESISFIVGLFILLISLARLREATLLRTHGIGGYLPTLLSFIGIFAGALCIVGKIIISDVFIQLLGAMLIIFAISNIISSVALDKIKQR